MRQFLRRTSGSARRLPTGESARLLRPRLRLWSAPLPILGLLDGGRAVKAIAFSAHARVGLCRNPLPPQRRR